MPARAVRLVQGSLRDALPGVKVFRKVSLNVSRNELTQPLVDGPRSDAERENESIQLPAGGLRSDADVDSCAPSRVKSSQVKSSRILRAERECASEPPGRGHGRRARERQAGTVGPRARPRARHGQRGAPSAGHGAVAATRPAAGMFLSRRRESTLLCIQISFSTGTDRRVTRRQHAPFRVDLTHQSRVGSRPAVRGERAKTDIGHILIGKSRKSPNHVRKTGKW